MKLLPAVFISFVADAKEKKVKIDIRESESLIKKKNSSPIQIFTPEILQNFRKISIFLMIFVFFHKMIFIKPLGLGPSTAPYSTFEDFETIRKRMVE